MKSKTSLIFCKIALLANIVFWIVMVIGYAFTQIGTPNGYAIVGYLMLLEPVCFAIVLINLHYRRQTIYFLSLAFTLVNVFLSITDEIGLLDLTSATLSALAFVGLILIRREILEMKTIHS